MPLRKDPCEKTNQGNPDFFPTILSWFEKLADQGAQAIPDDIEFTWPCNTPPEKLDGTMLGFWFVWYNLRALEADASLFTITLTESTGHLTRGTGSDETDPELHPLTVMQAMVTEIPLLAGMGLEDPSGALTIPWKQETLSLSIKRSFDQDATRISVGGLERLKKYPQTL